KSSDLRDFLDLLYIFAKLDLTRAGYPWAASGGLDKVPPEIPPRSRERPSPCDQSLFGESQPHWPRQPKIWREITSLVLGPERPRSGEALPAVTLNGGHSASSRLSVSPCEFQRGPKSGLYLTVIASPLCKSFTTMSLFGCLRLSRAHAAMAHPWRARSVRGVRDFNRRALSLREPPQFCRALHRHFPFPQSSSASRFTAGAAGFFILSQSGDRPER